MLGSALGWIWDMETWFVLGLRRWTQLWVRICFGLDLGCEDLLRVGSWALLWVRSGCWTCFMSDLGHQDLLHIELKTLGSALCLGCASC